MEIWFLTCKNKSAYAQPVLLHLEILEINQRLDIHIKLKENGNVIIFYSR